RHAPVRPVLLGVFGQPEAEPGIEVDGVLYFCCEDVEMIEALRMAAAVEVVAPQKMRTLLHRRIKLDLETEGIDELQGAALDWLFGERACDAVLREECRRLVEVSVVADLKAKPIAGGDCRFPQHQRVMLMLFAAAQIHRIVIGVLDMQANGGLVEIAAEL